MKTPEEIKRALECHTTYQKCSDECPYECNENKIKHSCIQYMVEDAYAYIQQLEERIAQMKEQMRGLCPTCKHKDEYGQTCQECLFLNAHERPHWEYDELPGKDG